MSARGHVHSFVLARMLLWDASQCHTREHPGMAPAGMECDPDLCKGCAPAAGGAHAARADADGPAPACCNMRLRQRQHKRVAMGLSDIAGWGAILLARPSAAALVAQCPWLWVLQ